MRATLQISLLVATAIACARSVDDEPPDVLLISLDSVRADTLTFLDEETAPNMARLARRGVVFTQAVSGSSWTLPAHAQMFTGNPPIVNGVQVDSIRIDPRHPTLPELLGQLGYWSAGFFTGWYLSPEYGFGRGFDLYRSSMTIDPEANRELRQELERRGDPERKIASIMQQTASHQDITAKQVVADVRTALDLSGPGPRFLFAHFFDPHYDYIPPEPYDTRFDPGYSGAIDGRGYWDNLLIHDPSKRPARQISDRDLEHIRALYRGEIAWTDEAVGELLANIEETGRMDNTLVIVTADHGEEFYEHRRRGHRQGLFDEVLRVPLLIVPPRAGERSAPRTVDTQVTLSDLLPTILDYAGGEPPASVYGRSLRPLVEGGSLPARPAISSLLLNVVPPGESEPQYWLQQAVRTPEHKLIRTLAFDESGRPALKSILRFDLVADPAEADMLPDWSRAEMKREWEEFENSLAPLRAAFESLPQSPAEERGTFVRERFAHELGALGYVDSGEADTEVPAPEPWMWSPPPRLELPRKSQ